MNKKNIFLLSFVFSFVFINAQVKKPVVIEKDEEPLLLPKEIFMKHFNFKGFATILNDEAADENGNHLFVGEIIPIEPEELKRDSAINVILGLKRYSLDDPYGIIITTDKDYNTLQIVASFVGEKVIYELSKKQFTIGANFFDYLHVGDKSFSAWQPIIVQTNFKLQASAYFLVKDYSCILKDMIIENNNITIFTRSDIAKIGGKDAEKSEMITVNPANYHYDEKRFINVLEVIGRFETPYEDMGRMTLSEVTFADSAYYFTTSNLDQFALKTSNHLYQLKNNSFGEIPAFQEYLKWNNEYSSWININDFYVNANKNYLFLTHIGASKKEITFSKTDKNFNALQSKKIPLEDYADFDKMVVLSNGNIVLLTVNETGTWTYVLYNSDLQYIKELNSTISKKYYPTKLKESNGSFIECLFYINNVKQKDCLLEVVNIE